MEANPTEILYNEIGEDMVINDLIHEKLAVGA